MSWYNQDLAPIPSEKKSFTRRFWMPLGEERQVTFVDGEVVNFDGVEVQTPFKYEEYNLNLNGNWRNWFTRPSNPDEDILAQMGHRPKKVAVFTIIDHTEWKSKDGTVHKDELSLYVVSRRSQIFEQIQRLIAKNGPLRGVKFNVYRSGDKSPGVGSMLEFSEKVDLPDDVQPFNYLDVLKPKSVNEVREALGMSDPQSGQSNSSWSAGPQQNNNAWGNRGGGDSNSGWGGGTGGSIPF